MTEFFTATLGLNLNLVWFVLVGVLFTGYAVLDGFDLGVGVLHLFIKDDGQRRLMLNTIGPVWDGNEVWLVTGGGALFAAFPNVYATVFSGFYLAFMLLLAALIFRAVAIEFRDQQPQAWWRRTWDFAFGLSSLVVALLLGVAIGNIARGIPLTVSDGGQIEYAGGFFNLLNPYALTVGALAVTLFALHGCLYALLKTDGELREKLRRWAKPLVMTVAVFYLIVNVLTGPLAAHMEYRFSPLFIVAIAIGLGVVMYGCIAMLRQRYFAAFLSSCATIVTLMALFGLGMFPNLVIMPGALPGALALDMYNAASSQRTLAIMLVITLIGMPLVLTYTVFIYRVFRGKVKLDGYSY
ncbi:MAG: cytochrome d ubiquinol oxidase subunit II [Verrucomicrobiales bacterium]|jgi:cytochrome d ubiquinol oxidase subunit II|nr:cytochrome d ubiquinol oxidase subunit II [Verrucomicrobiales bacterium]